METAPAYKTVLIQQIWLNYITIYYVYKGLPLAMSISIASVDKKQAFAMLKKWEMISFPCKLHDAASSLDSIVEKTQAGRPMYVAVVQLLC